MEITRIDKIETIKSKIRNIPDFPEPGIQFKDITPVLQDPEALRFTAQLIIEPFKELAVDFIIGVEARGFIFGPIMAQALNAGFIPVRKPGKLPVETISASYKLEYGTDQLEMNKDALKPGDRVIIHDDLIATGGSVKAASELVEKAKGVVVGYSFIIELTALGGRKKLHQNVVTESLIRF